MAGLGAIDLRKLHRQAHLAQVGWRNAQRVGNCLAETSGKLGCQSEFFLGSDIPAQDDVVLIGGNQNLVHWELALEGFL